MMPADDRREEVLGGVREILLELRAGSERIRPEARLVADLGLDSLELASAVLSLEERFGIDLGDDFDELMTVGQVAAAITARLRCGDGAR